MMTGLILVCFPESSLAANPATINFQGKVVNADGTNPSNGTYSFIFRLYNTASPTTTTACGSDASCLFEETQGSVTVTNGVFQVELGSTCSGGLVAANSCDKSSAIDFSASNALYLTLKFNGDSAGFMSPTIHLTTVPYAFNADRLGGIAASGFIQNTTSVQSSSNFHISGTGTADTALSTPLLQTASGDLALQPASGIVALNKASTANELRVYENAVSPTNYASITATSSDATFRSNTGITKVGNGTGAITLSAGASAAVNITANAASTWKTTAGNLTLDSGGGTLVFGTATSTLQRASSAFALDVSNGASNSTLTVSNSGGAGNITLALDSGGSFAVGGSTGTTASACSGGQFLTGTLVGGIVTSGSCGAPTSGTLQDAYNASSSPATITQTAAKSINIAAGAAPTTDQLIITNSGFGTSTTGIDGLGINFNTAGTTASADNSGLRIDVTSNNSGTNTTLQGLKISDLSSAEANSTETGLYVGTGWDIGLDLESGGIQLAAGNDPTAPTSNNLKIYAKTIAGRVLPKWVGPSGVDTPFQANLGFNKIALVSPGGGTSCTTGMTLIGLSLASSAGTCANPAITSTNLFTSSRRTTYSTGTTAGTIANARGSVAQVWRGNASGLGGFFYTTRFGTSVLASGNRAFIGLEDVTTAPTNVDPTTNTTPGKVGLAINANSGNWKWVNNVSGTAPTVTDLGANFPVNTTSLYELVMFAPPNGSSITYRVKNLSTGNVTSDTAISTNIPASTTMLDPHWWITNNASAANAVLDYGGVYIETDN